ncbi:MAG: PAS domain-containing sensor histidine kinase [Candidatus Helarchaeota archaeon]
MIDQNNRVLQNTTDLIAILDTNCKREYLNEWNYKRVLGYSKDDLIEEDGFSLIHPDDFKLLQQASERCKKSGEMEIETRLRHKEGHFLWFELKGYKIITKEGKEKYVVIGREITAHKQAEQERNQLLQKIQKAHNEIQIQDQVKEEIFAELVHEIRNPLSSLIGFTEILLESPTLQENELEIIKVIYQNSQRINTIIEDLYEAFKSKKRMLQFQNEPFDVWELLNNLRQEYTPVLLKKRIDLEINAGPNQLVVLDKNQIARVIRNLLDNAIKFSPLHSRITIKSHIVKSRWHFSISDVGIGIKKTDLPHIFKQFYRGENAVKLGWSGLGIGLDICREIIEAYGGRIWAESPGEGKGATFIFEIPLSDLVINKP